MFKKIREFFHFLKYNTYPERMYIKARKVVMFGSAKAFRLFKDAKFRKMINFSQMEHMEQDRIFNELVITNLIFLMLLLDQIIQEITQPKHEDKREYLKALRKHVPEYFIDLYKRLKIDEKNLRLMKKLVDMRYDEYNRRAHDTRSVFLEHDELEDLGHDKRVVIFQAIAFGLYDHIMRGKLKKDDPLYKFLQPYLLYVYKGYLKKI